MKEKKEEFNTNPAYLSGVYYAALLWLKAGNLDEARDRLLHLEEIAKENNSVIRINLEKNDC